MRLVDRFNLIRRSQLGIVGVVIAAGGVVVFALGVFRDGPASRGVALSMIGAAMFVAGLLLPWLTGKVKLGPGGVEAHIDREQVVEAIETQGEEEGFPRDRLERLTRDVDRLLKREESRRAGASPVAVGVSRTRERIPVECADCGVIDPSADVHSAMFFPCRKCGSLQRRRAVS